MTRQVDVYSSLPEHSSALFRGSIMGPSEHDERWSWAARNMEPLKDDEIKRKEDEVILELESYQDSWYWEPKFQTKSNKPIGVIERKPFEKGMFVAQPSDQTGPTYRLLKHFDFPTFRIGIYSSEKSSATKEKERVLKKISSAKDQEEVLSILTERGLSTVVQGFRQYLTRQEKRLEEGEWSGPSLDSLKALAQFLVSYDLPHSEIKTDFDGNADLEWFLSSKLKEEHPDDEFWGDGDGQMILRFTSSKSIEFAILSGPWGGDKERLSLSGCLSHSKMKTVIDMFSGRMVSYGKR